MPSAPLHPCISTIRRRFSALFATALVACDGPSGDREQFRDLCEQMFACDCLVDPYADIDECIRDEAARRAGWLAQFSAEGLTPDERCMDSLQAPDPEMCLTWEEYEVRHPFDIGEPHSLCGVCSIASGDRQVGEPCTEFAWYGNVSDCAPGLICVGPRSPSGICLDPCLPTPEGMPCDGPVNTCAAGLHCSILDNTCIPVAKPGEACQDRWCADHYHCDETRRVCVPLAAAGESCMDAPCDWYQDLVCGPGHLCGPTLQLGEPCLGWCSDELVCNPVTKICSERGPIGEACEYAQQCAPGLYCEDKLCVPGRGPGEPCTNGGDPCQLGLTCVDGLCGEGQAMICGAL